MHGSADEEDRRHLLEGSLTVEAVDGRSSYLVDGWWSSEVLSKRMERRSAAPGQQWLAHTRRLPLERALEHTSASIPRRAGGRKLVEGVGALGNPKTIYVGAAQDDARARNVPPGVIPKRHRDR
jgi:hypothetical protein